MARNEAVDAQVPSAEQIMISLRPQTHEHGDQDMEFNPQRFEGHLVHIYADEDGVPPIKNVT